MKNIFQIVVLLSVVEVFAQEQVYEQRLLDAVEVDFIGSYYEQNGNKSAVNGGVGTEELDNSAGSMVVSIPVNNDGVLTVDAGISAYTSASSSNVNPFMSKIISSGGATTGASSSSSGGGKSKKVYYGSPWTTATGASRSDVLYSASVSYKHASKNRNWIWNVNASYSTEYDYESIGLGIGVARLCNDQNTELGFKAHLFLDEWKLIYPTELHQYEQYGGEFLNMGYFYGVDIFNQFGEKSKSYHPMFFSPLEEKNRHSYAFSVHFSQVLSAKTQLSLMSDVLYQTGLLSTPFHRVYFADTDNYFIGNPAQIPMYNYEYNTEVFHLADDIERLPNTRLKFPVGVRFHQYVNDFVVLKTYYRYYVDDWGLNAHTIQFDVPIRLFPKFVFTPTYRFHTQNEAYYFAGYMQHYSYQRYYTSDNDLSTFYSNQFGGSIKYVDAMLDVEFLGIGLKSAEIRYQRYVRSNLLDADIISFGIKLIK